LLTTAFREEGGEEKEFKGAVRSVKVMGKGRDQVQLRNKGHASHTGSRTFGQLENVGEQRFVIAHGTHAAQTKKGIYTSRQTNAQTDRQTNR
jgi:hypothetical protein